MTGIAGAVDYSVKGWNPRCSHCGGKFEDIGRSGKKLQCLQIMRVLPGIGLMTWCARECADEWFVANGAVVAEKIAEAVRVGGGNA